jgi:arabinose-5-phosphate isomerase
MTMVDSDLLQGKNIKNLADSYLKEMRDSLCNIEIDDGFQRAAKEIAFSKQRKWGSVKIITTGMGKAGIAMKKFSSILCSLGFRSFYLHPGEASHGDIGMLDKEDVLFVASTSGKTREVIETIELSRNLGVSKVIGITSHADSPIRDLVDIIIDMGKIKEIGEIGFAPTSSIIVISAITDCLAVIASEICDLKKSEYAKYHRSGYLGSVARGDGEIK